MTGSLAGNVTWVAGPTSGTYAIRFGGSNFDYVTYGDANVLEGSKGFTVFFHVIPTDPSASAARFLIQKSCASLFFLNHGASCKMNFSVSGRMQGGSLTVGRTATVAFTTDAYHTICVTYDGKGRKTSCKIYFDGARVDSNYVNDTKQRITRLTRQTDALLVGSNGFKGDIARLLFYTKPLSAKAVAKLHSNPSAGSTTTGGDGNSTMPIPISISTS